MTDSDEEFVDEEESEMGPALVKRLREKLQKAVEEKQEYLEGWQRSRADFANFKREEALIHGDREARVTAELLETFIPGLDALDLAVRNPAFEQAPVEWQKGIKGVYNEFVKSLSKIGASIYYPLGEPIDHHKQEVLREVPVGEEAADSTVVEVHRSGYKLGDTIIRPAQVSAGVFTK